MASVRARQFVALGAASEEHDLVAAQRILTEKVVQGGYQGPDERSILGKGFAEHRHEPAMDSPRHLVALIEWHEVTNVARDKRPLGGRRLGQDLVVGETDKSGVLDDRHHIV